MYNNYYNPYMTHIPNYMNYSMYNNMIPKKGLFNGLFSKFSLTGFLNGTNKTLNVINQAIPIYNQVKPMIGNAKTMFRVMSAVRNSDNKAVSKENTKEKKETKISNDLSPTFFA